MHLLLPLLSVALVAGPVVNAMPEPPTGDEARPRVRELGLRPGILPPGPHNAITDVAGILVGHRTLIEDDDVRTGVTAILPHGGNLMRRKVPAAVHVGNAYGKAAGLLQVQELGRLETPIVLTNTLDVGTALRAVVRWTLEQPGNEAVRSVNAVVGEVNDGHLNDIRGMHVREADVRSALEAARDGPVEEGCVGGGTGAIAFGWKGGIGTASRRLPDALGGYTVGALVQANFGGVLVVDGVRVGETLGRYPFSAALEKDGDASSDDGSCMIVLATDAPLGSRALRRLASRGILGLARTGSFMSHGSGDFVIAFSTAADAAPSDATASLVRRLPDERLSPLFLAAVESVEEAVYNALTGAVTMTGRNGHRVEAIPIEALRRLLDGRAREGS